MINVKFNKEENIIYVERIGATSLHDILLHIKDLEQRFNDFRNLYIIDDLRKSTTVINRKDLAIIFVEIKKIAKRFDQVKNAVITDNPMNITSSILFENTSKGLKNYSYKTFSTFEAAKHWLDLGRR